MSIHKKMGSRLRGDDGLFRANDVVLRGNDRHVVSTHAVVRMGSRSSSERLRALL
jgi:hypothetical protein